MAFTAYKSKIITGNDFNTLLTNLKKALYSAYSNFIVNYSFYKSKKPYLKIKKV